MFVMMSSPFDSSNLEQYGDLCMLKSASFSMLGEKLCETIQKIILHRCEIMHVCSPSLPTRSVPRQQIDVETTSFSSFAC